MGLVIKIKGAEAQDGKKLYRDALVSKGTLLLHDYSNKGGVYDRDLAKGALDLSREASVSLNVHNGSEFKYSPAATKPELTNGGGYRMDWLGRNLTYPDANNGIQLGKSLTQYLVDNKPHFVMICWVYYDTTAVDVGGVFLDPESSIEGGNGKLIRLGHAANGSGNFNPTLLGVTGGFGISKNTLLQYALEVESEFTPMNRFINGIYDGQTGDNYGFGDTAPDLFIGNNFLGAPQNMSAIMYRWVIEDLSVSGRNAADVVQEDWEYCNGIGKYAGTESKRPFIENV